MHFIWFGKRMNVYNFEIYAKYAEEETLNVFLLSLYKNVHGEADVLLTLYTNTNCVIYTHLICDTLREE